MTTLSGHSLSLLLSSVLSFLQPDRRPVRPPRVFNGSLLHSTPRVLPGYAVLADINGSYGPIGSGFPTTPLTLLAVMTLLAAVVFLLRRHIQQVLKGLKPRPEKTALHELMRVQKTAAHTAPDRYGSAVASIIRTFFEKRYGLPTQILTTTELSDRLFSPALEALHGQTLPQRSVTIPLLACLNRCDQLRFSGSGEVDTILNQAVSDLIQVLRKSIDREG